jgi:hypothetical protein
MRRGADRPRTEPNNRSPLNVEAADLWGKPEFKTQLLKHYRPITDDE